ncbi:MAG TPA: GNAT family N-acetyltransferase [Clostridiales bacterium]|nr:GNAT family N-acetyltransferase [Clostridiales bacterium]
MNSFGSLNSILSRLILSCNQTNNPNETRKLRLFRAEDTPRMAELFERTVRTVNRADYTKEQTAAWAAGVSVPQWVPRFTESFTVICESDAEILGFGNLTCDGTVDMLYVRADSVRCGIGAEILAALTAHARKCGLSRLQTFASLTAKPFFEKSGWQTVRCNTVVRRGVPLENFYMCRTLNKDVSVVNSTFDVS